MGRARQVSELRGGAERPARGNWPLTAPLDSPPRLRFRRVLYLRLPVPGRADRLLFEPDEVSLEGSFHALAFDLGEELANPLPASLTPFEGAVLVEMEAPRVVRRIDLAPAGRFAGGNLQLFALEEGRDLAAWLAQAPSLTERLAETPDLTVGVVGDLAGIEAGFEATLFACRATDAAGEPMLLEPASLAGLTGTPYRPGTMTQLGDGVRVSLPAPRVVQGLTLDASVLGRKLGLYRVDGKAVSDEPTTALVQTQLLDKESFQPAERFVGAEFVIRDDAEGGTLAPADIRRVRFRGAPTGPRLGLADPADLASPVFFWQSAGEITTAARGKVSAGSDLAAGLERYFADGYDGGDTAEVALVAESDSPCRFHLDTLEIGCRLEVSRFAPPREDSAKEVLRFSEEAATEHELAIELPGKADLVRADLEVMESLRGGSQAGGPPSTGSAEGRAGVLLAPGLRVCQELTPARAMTVDGVILAVQALEADTELEATLREDVAGEPTGRRLAYATRALAEPGTHGWARLTFSEPAVLSTRPHWLELQVPAGRAVWITAAGSGRLLVLEPDGTAEDNAGAFRTRTAHSDVSGLYHLLSPDQTAQRAPLLRLVAGGTAVPAQPAEEGRETSLFDLRPALAASLAAAASSSPVQLPLSFASSAAGSITVYPPTLVYRV